MTLRVFPFCEAHIRAIDVQPAQRWMADMVRAQDDLAGLETPFSRTIFDDDRIMVCAGIVHKWQDVGHLWSFVSEDAGRYLPAISFLAREFLAEAPWPRIEAHVEDGFVPGYRWAEMMGFERETAKPMRKAMGGRDFHLYALVR